MFLFISGISYNFYFLKYVSKMHVCFMYVYVLILTIHTWFYLVYGPYALYNTMRSFQKFHYPVHMCQYCCSILGTVHPNTFCGACTVECTYTIRLNYIAKCCIWADFFIRRPHQMSNTLLSVNKEKSRGNKTIRNMSAFIKCGDASDC